jgi:hypothetical protein
MLADIVVERSIVSTFHYICIVQLVEDIRYDLMGFSRITCPPCVSAYLSQ